MPRVAFHLSVVVFVVVALETWEPVGGGSDLRLWTVNGDLIGHVHCREIICSMAFSNQPEGVSVNVIAGGLENGVVR